MKKVNLDILIWKEWKHYVSQCLNNNVSSFGETKKESLKNLNEALSLYFEDDKNISSLVTIEKPELLQSSIAYA